MVSQRQSTFTGLCQILCNLILGRRPTNLTQDANAVADVHCVGVESMAAMAFRFPSVARTLGSWSNSITFHLHRITREREALPSTAPTILSNNINQLQPRPASYLDHENILPRRFTCLISDVGRCARHYEKHALFAVKEFNKQKVITNYNYSLMCFVYVCERPRARQRHVFASIHSTPIQFSVFLSFRMPNCSL